MYILSKRPVQSIQNSVNMKTLIYSLSIQGVHSVKTTGRLLYLGIRKGCPIKNII